MEIAALIILAIFSFIGFAAIFFTTFGTLIILIGCCIYSAITKFSIVGIKALLVIFALYLVGEIVEYISIVAGARKFGASNAAIAGALIGGLLGATVGAGFFGIGLIFGAFLGMFLGAFLVELVVKKDIIKSLKAGTGGILGRLGSIIFKVIIAIIMFAVMAANIMSTGIMFKEGSFTGARDAKIALELGPAAKGDNG